MFLNHKRRVHSWGSETVFLGRETCPTTKNETQRYSISVDIMTHENRVVSCIGCPKKTSRFWTNHIFFIFCRIIIERMGVWGPSMGVWGPLINFIMTSWLRHHDNIWAIMTLLWRLWISSTIQNGATHSRRTNWHHPPLLEESAISS